MCVCVYMIEIASFYSGSSVVGPFGLASSLRQTTLHISRTSAFSPSSIWSMALPVRWPNLSRSSCSLTSKTCRARTTASGRPDMGSTKPSFNADGDDDDDVDDVVVAVVVVVCVSFWLWWFVAGVVTFVVVCCCGCCCCCSGWCCFCCSNCCCSWWCVGRCDGGWLTKFDVVALVAVFVLLVKRSSSNCWMRRSKDLTYCNVWSCSVERKCRSYQIKRKRKKENPHITLMDYILGIRDYSLW